MTSATSSSSSSRNVEIFSVSSEETPPSTPHRAPQPPSSTPPSQPSLSDSVPLADFDGYKEERIAGIKKKMEPVAEQLAKMKEENEAHANLQSKMAKGNRIVPKLEGDLERLSAEISALQRRHPVMQELSKLFKPNPTAIDSGTLRIYIEAIVKLNELIESRNGKNGLANRVTKAHADAAKLKGYDALLSKAKAKNDTAIPAKEKEMKKLTDKLASAMAAEDRSRKRTRGHLTLTERTTTAVFSSTASAASSSASSSSKSAEKKHTSSKKPKLELTSSPSSAATAASSTSKVKAGPRSTADIAFHNFLH